MIRTHNCGELRAQNAGETVKLVGWVKRSRDLGGLLFLDLRDRYGLVQIVIDPADKRELHEKARKIPRESVIQVEGEVYLRPENMINPDMLTGEIEINPSMGKGKIIDEIFGERCEPHLIQPTFITDYPVEMSPLATKHREKPGLVERFEAICNGKEICNAFSELNDPVQEMIRISSNPVLIPRMPYGKHKGVLFSEIPEDYMKWLQTTELDEDMAYTVKTHLGRTED